MARQVPLSMGFPSQEYWRGLPLASPGHLANPGIRLVSPVSPAMAGRFFTPEPPGKPTEEVSTEQIQLPDRKTFRVSTQGEIGPAHLKY